MRMLRMSAALMIVGALVACDNPSSAPSMPTSAISVFTGAWRSTSTTTTAGVCTAINWSIVPTSASAATIAYTATCAGVPVTGTGTGTVSGTTLNWTTTGTAANACPFALSGTAVPTASADLQVAYSGTVCGLPVSGTDVLHR